jgi:hypothetical protein
MVVEPARTVPIAVAVPIDLEEAEMSLGKVPVDNLAAHKVDYMAWKEAHSLKIPFRGEEVHPIVCFLSHAVEATRFVIGSEQRLGLSRRVKLRN